MCEDTIPALRPSRLAEGTDIHGDSGRHPSVRESRWSPEMFMREGTYTFYSVLLDFF